MMIRMPLFFFVSGFLVDKPGIRWNLKDVLPFIRKKAKVQLIPTFVFMMTYIYLFNFSVLDVLFAESKGGYWFTITLFELFLLYSLCKMQPVRFQHKAMFVMSMIFWAQGRIPFLRTLPFWEPLQLGILKFFIYFSFGAFVKCHFNGFVKFLESKYYSVLLVAFFAVAFLIIKNSLLNSIPGKILSVFVAIAGICVVFNFFRKNEASFQQTTKIGRALQYIGKRTLDVYLLHYFFLPWNLGVVGDFFRTYSNPSLEFVCSILLALIVVGFCLIMSNIIRTSRHLAHWLFGVKLA